MSNYKYTEMIIPMTGDPIWKVDDISLAFGGVEELVQKFIENHKRLKTLPIVRSGERHFLNGFFKFLLLSEN